MPDIPLQRTVAASLFGDQPGADTHAGLWLSRGIARWPGEKTQKGREFQEHVGQVADIAPSRIYEAAYHRWCNLIAHTPNMVGWAGQLDGRLFIGLGGPSIIETAITLSRTYGVPVIPASAQKGLAQAYAKQIGMDAQDQQVLFGKVGQTPDAFDAGYVIYHDAWWTPNSAPTPLAREVVTVHHAKYYETRGATDATDFDSPVPNAQIAARGGFLFCVECADPDWAKLALTLLARGLEDRGIGGKTASGYGRFGPNESENKRLDDAIFSAKLALLPAKLRLRRIVEALSLDELPTQLGKDKNKTKKQYGDDWSTFVDLVAEIHGEAIKSWEHSDKKNEKKAYKVVSQNPERH